MYIPSFLHLSCNPRCPYRTGSPRRPVDPLGPMLFALTLQEPLEVVAKSNLARPLVYADNTLLQGARSPPSAPIKPSQPLPPPLAYTHSQLRALSTQRKQPPPLP
jgi:hypothetical protein